MNDPLSPVILLDPSDNVLVCRIDIHAGDRVPIDGRNIAARQSVAMGHKIARTALLPGDAILKYGAKIGVATHAVAPGDHLHLHNMASCYIASHTRQSVSGKEEG